MVNITDLPLDKQKEILERVAAVKKKSKYHNIKTTVNGVQFDSKKEASRYQELMQMQDAHIIRNLKLQPEFTLVEGFKTPQGEKVRPTKYVADFSYVDVETGHLVIEDVKSQATKTAQYKVKKKLLLERFGYEVEEV